MAAYWYEKHGANVCFIGNGKNGVMLEYNYNTHRFDWFSRLLYTTSFIYKGRTYDRNKSHNITLYAKVLGALLEDGIYEQAEESYEGS